MRSADGRTLVPVESQPAQIVQDALFASHGIALSVRVFDPEDEDPAVVACEQPIEGRGSNVA
jgi:hypothetical protein